MGPMIPTSQGRIRFPGLKQRSSSYLSLKNTYLCVCVSTCVWAYVWATTQEPQHTCGHHRTTWELVLSFYHVSSGGWPQAVRLVCRYLEPSHCPEVRFLPDATQLLSTRLYTWGPRLWLSVPHYFDKCIMYFDLFFIKVKLPGMVAHTFKLSIWATW